MRKIGTLGSKDLATRFQHFLAAQGVSGQIDEGSAGWDVWVHEEQQVDSTREKFAEFQAAPEASRFDAPIPVIDEPKPEPAEEPKPARRTMRLGRSGRIPLTLGVIVAATLVSATTNFGKVNKELLQSFEASTDLLWSYVRSGEIWRFYTTTLPHADILHLFFNMYWLYLFGGLIERIKGTRTLFLLLLFLAPFALLGQLAEDQLTAVMNAVPFHSTTPVGMSGIIFGLFGYLWMRSKLLPEEGFHLPPNIVMLLLIWLVICMTGVMDDANGRIANGAHTGGLLAGMVIGAAPRLWRGS